MADMTLAEYLRNRRLSEAVMDLRGSTEKVIDIALNTAMSLRMPSAQPLRNSMGQLPQKFEMENLIGSFLSFNYP